MKKAIMIFALATGIGVNGFSQTQVRGSLPISPVPATSPSAGLSQLEVQGNLLTQNSFFNASGTKATGSFTADARWNSMGNLPAASQTLNGFRTQTDGKGFAWGHSVPNGGVVSDPFVEWIGSTPGKLNFNYAFNTSGAAGARVPAFTIEPNATSFSATAGANAYTNKGFIGQLQSGAFGLFGATDIWSATGQISTSNFTTYGVRQQYQGYTLSSGLIKPVNAGNPNGILDFGVNQPAGVNPITANFKFRVFTDPSLPSSIKNVWQTNVADGNVMMGRQDISAVNASQFYLSVFDGAPITPPSFPDLLPVQRAGIYSTSNTITDLGVQLLSYASVVGDLRFATPGPSFQKYAILGLAEQTNPKNNWAGYFIGNVGYTGNLIQVSDKKFKTKIEDDNNVLEKLMQLQPKNYFFDREKYKNMAFNDKLQHGLISQEVEKIFPELVEDAEAPVTDKNAKTNTTAYKGINYTAFIPMLIKAIQEQELKIEKLETQIAASKNTFVLTDKTNLPSEIENKAFTLSQNTPNPFSEKTTISYTIPSNVKKATLAVFDLTGKMLLQYNLQAGKNTVAINGSTLPAGMYLYSLLADGQEVLSKRMVLTK